MKPSADLSPESLASQLAEIIPTHYLGSADLRDVATRWCERQRFWHGPAHLLTLIEEITARTTGAEREILLLTALYHDVIYNPRAADNEEQSAELLGQHAADPTDPVIAQALEIILDSKWQRLPESKLGRLFFELDTHQLSDDCPLSERLIYERAIFREFQWAPWADYREKRAAFLQVWAERYPQHRRGAAECAELLAALNPRIAVYPGSFNPLHRGHLSILRQAEQSFDKVIIALGVNRQKTTTVDALEKRQAELQGRLIFHEVCAFGGLLSDFLDSLPLPVTVVRGVRDGTDLEAELRFARFLDELRPDTSVVWIGCEPALQHVSSSGIRELESIQPGAGARYLPETSAIYGSA